MDWPRKLTNELQRRGQGRKLMAEGEETNTDAADAGPAGVVDAIEEGEAGQQPTSGAGATGADPAGFEPSGVGGEASRPGDWNPGEHSGGGGEVY
jgi:hypothetical protein